MSGAAWIGTINEYASAWSGSMLRTCWQGGLLALALWAVSLCWKRIPSSLRYALWLSVCMRLVLGLCVLPLTLPLLPPANAINNNGSPRVGGYRETVSVYASHTLNADAVSHLQSAVSNFRPASATLSLNAWLLLAWATSVLCLSVLSGVMLYRLLGRMKRSIPVSDPVLLMIAQQTAVRVGLRKLPRMLISENDGGVFTLGTWRPVVMLTRETLERCSAGELALVFAHEFAHIKRGDAWYGLLPHAARILFFFHPLAWLACREVDVAREAACDEQTITGLNTRSDEYGRLLLKLGVQRTSWFSLCAPGASSHYRVLQRRLTMLQYIQGSPRRMRGRVMLVACLAAAAVAMPWSIVHAQDPTGPVTGTAAAHKSPGGKGTTPWAGHIASRPGTAHGAAISRSAAGFSATRIIASGDVKVGTAQTLIGGKIVPVNDWHGAAPAPPQKRETRVFHLKFADSSSVAKSVLTLFAEEAPSSVKVVSDAHDRTQLLFRQLRRSLPRSAI